MSKRALVAGAYALLGLAIGTAWGPRALLVYGFFVLVSLAYALALVGWSRMIQHAARTWAERTGAVRAQAPRRAPRG
jgi:hypothetical protein